jgi:hypothetical protein
LPAQQVFREVETGIGKPLGGFDIVAIDEYALTLVADDAAVIPYLGPERFLFVDRPLIKCVVIGDFAR